MAHHGRELPAGQAHLAEEGTASQEASSVLARFGQ
jgi:lipoic acid synthetase